MKGGITTARDVNAYQPPKGPTSVTDKKSPGLHGSVYPGGSQNAGCDAYESGAPGLGGKVRKQGSQR